jgi:predicted dehydrogenase
VSDKQLRVGVLGLRFGLEYMRKYIVTERGKELVRVVAVCDTNAERLKRGGDIFGCTQYASFDTMLADPNIEAVAIYSGPIKRAELVRKAIRAGKHVMTTKPFELDPVAAADVLAEAQKLGKVVQLNSPPGQRPSDMKQIFAWQKEFNLGRPVAAHWQTWAKYNEKPDGSWYDDPALCPVAPIFRLGIYAINEILFFLHDPQQVQVMHSRLFTGRPTPDHALLTIRFNDGALASVFATFCTDSPFPYPDRLTLNFERGVVYKNMKPDSGRLRIDLELVTKDPAGNALLRSASGFDHEECGGHRSYQWDVFCRAVRGEPASEPTSPQHIIDGVRIVAAMARSEKSGNAEPV